MSTDSDTGQSSIASMPVDWDISGSAPEEGSSDIVVDGNAGEIILLTDAAREEVRRLIEAEGKDGLRLGIKGGGCSGLSYELDFTEHREGDTVVEFEGFKVFLDKKSTIYLRGITLDFQSGLNGRGFVFQNPQASNTCGCGESFSL